VDEEKKLVTVARVVYAKRDYGRLVGVMEMGKLVEVTLEIDAELKEQAEKVCLENGLTLEEATVLFFEETVRLGRLPFELDEELREYMVE
jgi:addiction module RelB/DinJ family antitoxin